MWSAHASSSHGTARARWRDCYGSLPRAHHGGPITVAAPESPAECACDANTRSAGCARLACGFPSDGAVGHCVMAGRTVASGADTGRSVVGAGVCGRDPGVGVAAVTMGVVATSVDLAGVALGIAGANAGGVKVATGVRATSAVARPGVLVGPGD
jgi:hypothetical protein